MKNKKAWIHGLIVTILTSLGAGLTLAIKSPASFNLQSDWKSLVFTSLGFGLFAAGNYLFQNKLVFEDEAPATTESSVVQVPIKQNPNITVRLLSGLISLLLIQGCAPLVPKTENQTTSDYLLEQATAWASDPSNQEITRKGLVITGKTLLAKYGGEDRQKIALQMYTAANAFSSLATGDLVTSAQVDATVKSFLDGQDSSQYSEFTDEANLVWSLVYSKLKFIKDPSLVKTWLLVLASAAQEAAESNK